MTALNADSPSSSLLFLLGSGASKQSDIKTGSEMVADWLEMLRLEDPNHESVPAHEWATAQRLGIPDFDPQDPGAAYPAIFARAYHGRRQEGFDYLEREIAGKEPSFGYSVLAQVLQGTRHKVVVTTNFDNLVIDALSIYATATPLVCGHESLAGFIRHRPSRPQIVKVHRDLLYAPRNTPDEVGPLPEDFARALRELFKAHVPVVIGYGANDGSLMGVLEALQPGALTQGLYWCYWHGAGLPRRRILELVAKHTGWLVPINGFDELMIKVQERLALDPLDDFLKRRGDERADRYKERRDKLGQDLRAGAEASVGVSTGGAQEVRDQYTQTLQALRVVMTRNQNTRTARQWDSLAKLESDQAKQAQIYIDGLAALPKSAWMSEYAALFFAKGSGSIERAEELHKQAVSLAPGDPAILGNYANFLTDERNNPDAAEAMYKVAIEADPGHANNLGNYASFLAVFRRDRDSAEAMFKRAIEANPKHANNLVNYAVFLVKERQNSEAGEAMFKRAIEVEPWNPMVLCAYGWFLWNTRRDVEAAEAMFTRAIARQPMDAGSMSLYARFLAGALRNTDTAEAMFKRAIDADPRNGRILRDYALFLADVRKDVDAADEMYKRAIRSSPGDAGIINDYALWLADERGLIEAADEMYQRAVATGPAHSGILSNYAVFLWKERRNRAAAEEMHKRAVEEDPDRPGVLVNYANFLAAVCRDFAAAEATYQRAIELHALDPHSAGNYAWMLLSEGRMTEGVEMLNKAIAVLSQTEPGAVHVECWMYAYCFWPVDQQRRALGELKALINSTVVRTGDWDFAGIIGRAKANKHPQVEWLPRLVEVISGRAAPSTLDEWSEWRAVRSQ